MSLKIEHFSGLEAYELHFTFTPIDIPFWKAPKEDSMQPTDRAVILAESDDLVMRYLDQRLAKGYSHRTWTPIEGHQRGYISTKDNLGLRVTYTRFKLGDDPQDVRSLVSHLIILSE